jgi:hypothetical protein
VGAVIVKHDAPRILMPLLIHCGTLNYPCIPHKSPAGSDDENSRFPFQIEKNVIEKIILAEFASVWQEVEHD